MVLGGYKEERENWSRLADHLNHLESFLETKQNKIATDERTPSQDLEIQLTRHTAPSK